ncbi:MAG: class B sortase [Peptococcaceae bacterium]|jgi:sortase B|nr:class B sortase [Peptococcaceae bacterium]
MIQNQRLRRGLIILFGLIFVISLTGLLTNLFAYRQGEQIYQEAASLVKLPDLSDITPAPIPNTPELPDVSKPEQPYIDPYADALQAMDFSALREVNSEVLGWLLVPNTGISYPLLQHANNEYYLGHSWNKSRSPVGAIFMDSQCSKGLGNFNTIIYGHRMNNGSMFTPLAKYKDQSYWQNHPTVYITDDNGTHRYDIFAAYEVSTSGMTYALSFSTDAGKQKFINYCLEQSLIDTGLQPTVNDYILTLSTCTGRGHATRWVVQAVRKGEEPTAAQPEENQTEATEPNDELKDELSQNEAPEQLNEPEQNPAADEPKPEQTDETNQETGLTDIIPTAN